MGAIILSASYNAASGRKERRSAIGLSGKAADRALISSGIMPDQLGCFINAGIFRDKHIGEPAIATLIHGSLKNPVSQPFCFDLLNGKTGQLDGIEIIDSLIANRQINFGMVVAGDAIPRKADRKSFPYESSASAILLAAGSEDSGFIEFYHKSFPEKVKMHTAELQFRKKRNIRKPDHYLFVQSNSEYRSERLKAVDEAVFELCQKLGLTLDDFDLVLSSEENDRIHTAALGAVINRSIDSGLFDQARNILFISAGSGIQVSLAWYKNKLK